MSGQDDEKAGARPETAGPEPENRPSGRATMTPREARLAEALRANLRRRKAAARLNQKNRDEEQG